ncbi:hypothetical protein C0993_004723 [Termitomyces sp. T159_Od127]|nr:hypothetical protein C0993_004723 [Termitomyces sp. T159_Od127]
MTAKKLGPSAVDIQNHLYTSFLEGSTADVALRVHGTWDAIYKLHRVVLIQSGFFRSLFTAGFAESTPRIGSCTGPEEIVIHFDDPNITRAAFEVCISRLYGGGPTLDIDPSLTPTFAQPLTPSFPYEPQPHKAPSGHHPATPRFLMSLLATAVYLSIPSLASQALSSILSTIGPRTVIMYLDFATGVQIGYSDRESDEPEAAVGLESVACLIDYEESISDAVSIQADSSLGNDHMKKTDAAYSKAPTSSISLEASEECETKGIAKQPSCHYGAISDKIGEACACWLAKWGVDIFQFEEKQESSTARKEHSMHLTQKRSKSAPSGSVRVTGAKTEQYCVPLIWSRGGLSARWAAAIISADTFFIRGERERYNFARRVVESRRKYGIVASEEEEWDKLFDHGIYYSNMFAQNMDDLISISRDISPTTNKPFVPLSTIQASLWTQSVLRHRITVRPGFSRSQSGLTPSPSIREKELGVTLTTADILMASSTPINESKFYFPVTGNSSVRIGNNGSDFSRTPDGKPLSMDQLFSCSSTSTLSPLPSSPTLLEPVSVANSVPTTEAECFGLRPSIYTASAANAFDPKGKFQWSPYPPCRFAVEFWGLDSLNEKSRLYSHTISYAGSMFNTYIQIARKKGQVQLGIYLHRQSNIEPIPQSSVPALSSDLRNDSHNFPLTLDRGSSPPPTISSPPVQDAFHQSSSSNLVSPRSMTPTSGVPSTPLSSSSLSSPLPTPSRTAAFTPVAPSQQYRDPRPLISAYFMITCASTTGTSQFRFASAPDVFSVGQSWGWKSSSMTEEYMGVRSEKETSSSDSLQSKYYSLRATVILGLV